MDEMVRKMEREMKGQADLLRKMRIVLEVCETPIALRHIKKRVEEKIAHRTVQRTIYVLINQGYLERTEYGIYRRTEKGNLFLKSFSSSSAKGDRT